MCRFMILGVPRALNTFVNLPNNSELTPTVLCGCGVGSVSKLCAIYFVGIFRKRMFFTLARQTARVGGKVRDIQRYYQLPYTST